MQSYGFEDDERAVLIVPDYDPDHPSPSPGNIQPGYYTMRGLVDLLRTYAEDPEAIRFIADLLEP
jgi:hypothetical protein